MHLQLQKEIKFKTSKQLILGIYLLKRELKYAGRGFNIKNKKDQQVNALILQFLYRPTNCDRKAI